MATAVMDQYMKMTTSKFVREALGDPIQKILETKQSCDVSASFILPIQSSEISHSPSHNALFDLFAGERSNVGQHFGRRKQHAASDANSQRNCGKHF